MDEFSEKFEKALDPIFGNNICASRKKKNCHINFLYRVSQKKVSLVKISCGKYNSGWWEIHEEFFDKSSCAALSNHWLLTNEVIY